MKFSCPHCGQHLDGESGYAGRSLECPACHQPFTVPRVGAGPAPAAAVAARPVPAAVPVARAALPVQKHLAVSAILSFVFSLASLLIGPLGFLPGIICGHVAKKALRKDPALGGRGFATAGLAIGYTFLALTIAGLAVALNLGLLTLPKAAN